MHFLYAVINFLLLAGVIWLFGRKTIRSIFTSRRERINRELDEAEAIEKELASAGPEAEPEPPAAAADDAFEAELRELRSGLEAELAHIEEQTAEMCRNMRREMLAELKDEFVVELKERSAALLRTEPYFSAFRARQDEIADEILGLITLTPGDTAYLKMRDELYVTLTSAYPLEERVTDRIERAARALLDGAGGKISYRVRENEALIGGFQLRIGDTVYGYSADDELYYLGSTLRKRPVTGDEDAAAFAEEAEETIGSIRFDTRRYQRGHVISVSDGICWMDGLADIMYGEVVEFENGMRGMVLDIKPDRIGCIIYGQYEHVESGDTVRRVGRIATVPVGEELLGRVVDPLGRPIDGKGRIWTTERRPIEFGAPAIPDREAVSRPLHTGIKAIDALVPIGRGQRELIIGDRQTGKTSVAVDTIISQKGRNVPCIYVAVGQKDTTVAEICERLTACGAMEYTTIVCAPASSSASFQYIAPFAGAAMAEYFMYAGRDALIIYDDLSKHAVAYRELSLLLHRPSGREAYPGDVFYLHSRLLERAAQLSAEAGGGSITALPIIETQAGDISAYIPTNVISITDGQIFLESDLFNAGQRPAVNVGLSVSRVGGAAQTGLMKQTASKLRVMLAQYRELEAFAQFGTELDSASRAAMESGSRMMASLRQERYTPMPDWQQALLLYAVQEGAADSFPPERMGDYERQLLVYMEGNEPELVERLKTGKKLDEQTRAELRRALAALREVEEDGKSA